jgi:hypothetical protein
MLRAVVSLCIAAVLVGCCAGGASAQARSEYGYSPPILEPRPPSGIGAMVVGYGGIALGVEQLLTIPICYADFYPFQAERPCLIASLTVASVALAVGIPSLVVGLHRRERYKAWRQRQLSARQLGLFGDASGGGLRYAARF